MAEARHVRYGRSITRRVVAIRSPPSYSAAAAACAAVGASPGSRWVSTSPGGGAPRTAGPGVTPQETELITDDAGRLTPQDRGQHGLVAHPVRVPLRYLEQRLDQRVRQQ